VSQRKQRPRFRVVVLISTEPSGDALSGSSETITCDDLSTGLHEAFVAARRVFLTPRPLAAAGGV
jgi:hypothetical protein